MHTYMQTHIHSHAHTLIYIHLFMFLYVDALNACILDNYIIVMFSLSYILFLCLYITERLREYLYKQMNK